MLPSVKKGLNVIYHILQTFEMQCVICDLLTIILSHFVKQELLSYMSQQIPTGDIADITIMALRSGVLLCR